MTVRSSCSHSVPRVYKLPSSAPQSCCAWAFDCHHAPTISTSVFYIRKNGHSLCPISASPHDNTLPKPIGFQHVRRRILRNVDDVLFSLGEGRASVMCFLPSGKASAVGGAFTINVVCFLAMSSRFDVVRLTTITFTNVGSLFLPIHSLCLLRMVLF